MQTTVTQSTYRTEHGVLPAYCVGYTVTHVPKLERVPPTITPTPYVVRLYEQDTLVGQWHCTTSVEAAKIGAKFQSDKWSAGRCYAPQSIVHDCGSGQVFVQLDDDWFGADVAAIAASPDISDLWDDTEQDVPEPAAILAENSLPDELSMEDYTAKVEAMTAAELIAEWDRVIGSGHRAASRKKVKFVQRFKHAAKRTAWDNFLAGACRSQRPSLCLCCECSTEPVPYAPVLRTEDIPW